MTFTFVLKSHSEIGLKVIQKLCLKVIQKCPLICMSSLNAFYNVLLCVISVFVGGPGLVAPHSLCLLPPIILLRAVALRCL